MTDFKAQKTTKNSITLGWKKPISDGGSYVTAYILEQSEGEEKWKMILKGKNTSHTIGELTEGKEYLFRVKALNESGEGPPTELSAFAKDQFGKHPALLRKHVKCSSDCSFCSNKMFGSLLKCSYFVFRMFQCCPTVT